MTMAQGTQPFKVGFLNEVLSRTAGGAIILPPLK